MEERRRSQRKNRLQRGPETTLVRQTLEFIYDCLPAWRDDTNRPEDISEDSLNLHLCDFLDVMSRKRFPMIRFSREEPQAPRRSVDLSVKSSEGILIAGRTYTIYDALLVIEGKRLPAPSRDREREYASGGDELTGGIQRFKLGLHGAKLEQALMVGYLQRKKAEFWFATINGWIDDLLGTSSDGCVWEIVDRLRDIKEVAGDRISVCESRHRRASHCCSESINLAHVWVEMI